MRPASTWNRKRCDPQVGRKSPISFVKDTCDAPKRDLLKFCCLPAGKTTIRAAHGVPPSKIVVRGPKGRDVVRIDSPQARVLLQVREKSPICPQKSLLLLQVRRKSSISPVKERCIT